ncbi:hypothetical protein [Taklimakanibacter deserti]|uniref:hypothetical protein n=1 Tax=Taklimakanibacter deserti TaxID=2267839 RepID=UPI000E64933F
MSRPHRVITDDRPADQKEIAQEAGTATATSGEIEPEPETRCATPAKAEERLKAASAELARVETAYDNLAAQRDRLEAELLELAAEHKALAADAVAGKIAARERVSELVKRRLMIEHEALPSLAIALEAVLEPIGPARRAHSLAQAEVHRHDMIAAGQAVVSEDRKVDLAMEKLSAALAARDASIEKFSAMAATPLDHEVAHRLTTSEAIDCATAFHGLPASEHIHERDMKPLAAIDAMILQLED